MKMLLALQKKLDRKKKLDAKKWKKIGKTNALPWE